MQLPRSVAISTTALFIAALINARDTEKQLKAKAVPYVVRAAALHLYPKATLAGWSQEVDQGKTTYEVSVRQGSKKLDLVLAGDGTLLATEEKIAISQLPLPVAAEVTSKYPAAIMAGAERITPGDGGEMQYEVTLKKAAKKEILLNSDGKILKEE